MTRRSPRRSLPATLAVIASLSGAAFLGVFGGLSYQMAKLKDPTLGPKARALAAAANAPVNRRIVKRTVVVRKVRRPAPATAPAGAGIPVSASAPAPVVVQSAPVPVPAPPPAPVVTRTS